MEKELKGNGGFLADLQKAYIRSLVNNPLLTKATTSGVVSVCASLTSQLIDQRKGNISQVTWTPALRYGLYAVVISAPVMHYFYKWLDHTVPGKSTEAKAKRLLLERLLFTPAYMVVYHSAMAGLEFQSVKAMKIRLQMAYWATLLINWKYITPFQLINMTYIPREMRVLFGNLYGYLFSVYLASVKPKTA